MKQKRKGRFKRILVRTVVSIAALFIVACFVFDHFVQFRMSDEKLNEWFTKNHIPGTIHYYTAGARPIRYISIGSDTLPTLFMIHGSPSSLSIYQAYFADTGFLRQFRMVAVDRPGYGYSGFGHPEPSISKQADLLWPILAAQRKKNEPLLLLGGSYGSSVACRLVMDHPDCADGLQLIAPSLAPGQEKVYWFTRLVESPLIRWFIPRMLRSANTEKIHHEKELRQMLPYWNRITIPVSYLQGAKDGLIYTSNAVFARKMLVNCPHLEVELLKNRPHFFVFSDRLIIRRKILELYAYMKSQKLSPGFH